MMTLASGFLGRSILCMLFICDICNGFQWWLVVVMDWRPGSVRISRRKGLLKSCGVVVVANNIDLVLVVHPLR